MGCLPARSQSGFSNVIAVLAGGRRTKAGANFFQATLVDELDRDIQELSQQAFFSEIEARIASKGCEPVPCLRCGLQFQMIFQI
jgi:hypothetical protein